MELHRGALYHTYTIYYDTKDEMFCSHLKLFLLDNELYKPHFLLLIEDHDVLLP